MWCLEILLGRFWGFKGVWSREEFGEFNEEIDSEKIVVGIL